MRHLKDIKGESSNGRAWCGPTALAHITGLPYTDVEDLIRQIRSGVQRTTKSRVLDTEVMTTTGWYDLLMALEAQSIDHDVVEVPSKFSVKNGKMRLQHPTVTQFMRTQKPGTWWLVRVTGHFMVLFKKTEKLVIRYDNMHHSVLLDNGPYGYARSRLTHAVRIIDTEHLWAPINC